MWRDFNRRLSGLFGGKGGGPRPTGPGNGGNNFQPDMRNAGVGIGLIAGVVVLIWAGSGFFIVQEGQQAVVTSFGKYDHTANAGFTDGAPWLPVPETHRLRNVAVQEADAGSVLNAVRAFLRWRKAQPALSRGAIRFLDAPDPILAFVRERDGQRLLVALNLSPEGVEWRVPEPVVLLDAPAANPATLHDGLLRFPPRGAAFAALA